MNRMHKKVCTTLNYIETFLFSTITGCMSIYAFASLLGVLIGITKSLKENLLLLKDLLEP